MRVLDFIKNELKGWGKYERIFFPAEIFLIIALSLYIGDNKIALISAICGISYTILAGKGKISCYLFGLTGTLCYTYIAYKNHLYGNMFLYLLYYFPMQVVGVFKWKKHLKKTTNEIEKTSLKKYQIGIYLVLALLCSVLFAYILKINGGKSPYVDSITTVFSVFGLVLTIKRCIEQWYVWTVVNALSVIMWIGAYINGSNCMVTIIMWGTYLVLGVYFLAAWRNELNNQNKGKINTCAQ